MTRPRYGGPGPTGYRAPTNPDLILRERRTPPEVDGARRPRSLNDLTEDEQALYVAQLAALRAAVNLIDAEDRARLGDVSPRFKALAAAWVDARDTYQNLLTARLRQRRT